MTIHQEPPFPQPEDAVRRLRGRLGGAVCLLTSGTADSRAGLTVASLMIAAGEQGHVLALIDPDSDFADAVERTRRARCHWLHGRHQQLAEAFAGQMPAPGGAFRLGEFEDTEFGPSLVDAGTSADLELSSTSEVGWSLLMDFVIARVSLGPGSDALEHRRGRYRVLGEAE